MFQVRCFDSRLRASVSRLIRAYSCGRDERDATIERNGNKNFDERFAVRVSGVAALCESKMSEEQPTFKVTDRRLFNADGTPRDIEREEETAPTPEVNAASAASSSTEEVAPAPAPVETDPTPPNESSTAASSTDAQPQAAPPSEEPREDEYEIGDLPGADDPASFINFLMSIASNAAAALGMMEHPATGERSVDLQLGKHWIDVLGMMEQKTRGNHHPQEAQILEGLLADLRMQFVSLNRAAAQQPPPRGFTGKDIIGGK